MLLLSPRVTFFPWPFFSNTQSAAPRRQTLPSHLSLPYAVCLPLLPSRRTETRQHSELARGSKPADERSRLPLPASAACEPHRGAKTRCQALRSTLARRSLQTV